jgi:hypothetical protein
MAKSGLRDERRARRLVRRSFGLGRRGRHDLSRDDFFGAMHETPYEDNARLEALLGASGWLVGDSIVSGR